MHLVAPLLGGITGAEGGTAQLYVRGSTTRATYYLDFAGNMRVSSGADVELDPYGSARVYVNSLVDVVALDQAGVEVRRFVAGSSSSSMELLSSAYTGVDYVTGAGGFSKPTTVHRTLDRAITSFGSADWGTLQATFAPTYRYKQLFVSPMQFGAAGTGSGDDGPAIGRAIAFAAQAGGVVLFPYGKTFRVTGPVVVPSGVTLYGVGKSTAVRGIVQADHSFSVLSIQSSAAFARIENLTLSYGTVAGVTALSAPTMDVRPGSKVRIAGCNFAQSSIDGYIAIAIASDSSNPALDNSTEVYVSNTDIRGRKFALIDYRRTRPDTLPTFVRCRFGSAGTSVTTAYGVFSQCWFEGNSPVDFSDLRLDVETGTNTGPDDAEDPRVIVRRCKFASIFAIRIASKQFNDEGGGLFEDQSLVGSSDLLVDFTAGSSTGFLSDFGRRRVNGVFGSAASRVERTTSNATNEDLNPNYDTAVVTRSAATSTTVWVTGTNDGRVRRLFVANASGGVLTQFVKRYDEGSPAAGAEDFPNGTAGVSMANGTWRLWEWVEWPLATSVYSGTTKPKPHFAVICDGVAVGSPT